MKQFFTLAIFVLLAFLFCTSCIDKYENIEKYQRPEWLDGKIYSQISRQDSMSIFAQFMVDVGYDEVVDKTGTYAAFVPSDSAMRIFLLDKYGTYNHSDIDSSVKANIVKYHILPMPWSKEQLQSLTARGWISMNDVSNNKPTAFKRRTLLREPNKTYNIQRFLSGRNPFDIIVPDHVTSSTKRTVYSNSPKYVPFFFDGFMNSQGLSSSDYTFYFNRSYELGQIYFANSKILGDEKFAENGFVYTIDQVVEPLKNTEQLLEDGNYSKFLQLIHNNSVFRYNQNATLAQEGAAQGAEVDDLYDLSYTPVLSMNIHDEIIFNSNYTVERHNGLLAPTDEAMDEFFNDYLKAWGNTWNSIPRDIQRIIVRAHMVNEPVYEKDINNGFYNDNGDIVDDDDITIENVSYGSNSTFIGLKKAIVPKFFSSVSAPLFLDPTYSSFFGAYNSVNLLYSMKDPFTDFSLFIIDNQSLAIDSSLFVTEIPGGGSNILAYDHSTEEFVNMLSQGNIGILRRKLYGQIGVQAILGLAEREFIETVDGRHIVVQNDTVSGGVPSKFGVNSGRDTTVVFSEITKFPIINGRVYQCNGWLEFPTTNTYRHLDNTKFLTLLNKVGLANVSNNRLTFINSTERYTIFVPSDSALNSIQVDTLSIEDLKNLVSFHIVKGSLIFTDGRQPQGAYRTLNDQFLHLNPQPDNLLILDRNYNIYYDNLVLSQKSNLIGMHSQDISENYYFSNAVVHHIDSVIIPY